MLAASCELSYVWVAPAEALSIVVGPPLAIVKTFPDTFQDGEQLSWQLRDLFHADLLPNDSRFTDEWAGWRLRVSDAPSRNTLGTLAKSLVLIDEEEKK